jgi:hypothetical protein
MLVSFMSKNQVVSIVDAFGNERQYVLTVEGPSFEDLELDLEVGAFFAGWEVNQQN